MSFFNNFSTATNVEIELPVATDATNPNVRTSMGSSTYAPEKDALIWKIKSFPGGKVSVDLIIVEVLTHCLTFLILLLLTFAYMYCHFFFRNIC